MGPAEFASRVQAEYQNWGKVVKASGFSADTGQ
jgi:tripartite-type tricarboxylate transporter receptor subunit TctC